MAITGLKITLNKELSYPIVCTGGLNEQVSNIELKAGELIACSNYVDLEDIYSGYQSAEGYERTDGTALASATDVVENEAGDVTSDVAREAVRTGIKKVGDTLCKGSVTGVHIYKDVIYAWRNNAAVTDPAKNADVETLMFKSTTSGWSQVLLTGNLMGPGATVKAVNGRFSLFASNAEVMAWVDGVTNGFYIYDGTTITFVTGGTLPAEAPINIGIWKNRLFIVYAKGHIFFSVVGDPDNFASVSGAGEIFIGDDVTDLVETPSGTYAIFTKTSTSFLYYETTQTAVDFLFRLETFSNTVGSKTGTAKNILGTIYFADAQGLVSIATTQAFGDFGAKSISKKVQQTYIANKDRIKFSIADTETGRYYLFYNNVAGTETSGLVFTFKGTYIKGITKVTYSHAMTCITEAKSTLGNRTYYFGATDGYVRKMFSGTSFDGGAIVTSFTTSYYNYLSPRAWKFFHRLKFEASCIDNFNLAIKARFNYSETNMPSTQSGDIDLVGTPGRYGEDLWGEIRYSSSAIGGNMFYFTGYGTNMSLSIATSSKYKNKHNIHNFTVDYSIQSTQV